jgi:hypothetical protein
MKKRTFLQAMLASGSVGLLTARYLQPPKSASLPLQPPEPAEAPQPSILPEFADTTPQEEFELVMLQENELHPGFRHNEREPETQ